MDGWSFDRPGFRLNPHDLLGPLTVNPTEVLNKIGVPEMSLEQLVSGETDEDSESQERPTCQIVRIARPMEFAVSLKAYLDKLVGICPFFLINPESSLNGHSWERSTDFSARSGDHGLLRNPSNLQELREELFEPGEMSELTCFKPEPRASPHFSTR
jgi:hypothetical protein